MEPPSGVWAYLYSFLWFLPYFIGLLILGTIKGIIFCPAVCLIMVVGNSSIIIGLWPAHAFWTYYNILRAKQIGPVLKVLLCPCLFVLLILWPVVGIAASIVGGAAFGFFSPILATFHAVGEGKTHKFYHCICDGTWSTVLDCFTVVRDFGDVCFHSYFSIIDALRDRGPDAEYYEIRLLYLPGSLISGFLGVLVDVPIITLLALYKSPYMLLKGWKRLLLDLIGREGPFLDTICVPFAGLAILLWPLAVVGAVLGSMVSSVVMGVYAGVVAYQESSTWMGLRYIVAAVAIYDEYSNDIIDMPEGTCFPRPYYRKKDALPQTSSFSRPNSFQKMPSRSDSLKNMTELKPFELLDSMFKECHYQGEILVSEGVLTASDIEDAKSGKDNNNGIISLGLLAYCILQMLIRSAKANSSGLLLSDNSTEITSTNRPVERFFDWFFSPLLIMKEQIKAQKLSPAEEDYLGKLVLLSGDYGRVRNSFIGNPPESDVRRAELEALARRLRGITKSISRYPTVRRRFENLTKSILETPAKNGENQEGSTSKAIGGIVRFLSNKSFKRLMSDENSDSDSYNRYERDVEIQ